MITNSKLAGVAVAFAFTASPVFAQTVQSGIAAHKATFGVSSANQITPAAAHRSIVGGARPYDGAWSVVIQTTRGGCPAGLRAGMHIASGRLSASDQSYELNGNVAQNGAVRVTVSAGGQSASGFGRLAGDAGRGLWRTSSGECSGQWTAERRG